MNFLTAAISILASSTAQSKVIAKQKQNDKRLLRRSGQEKVDICHHENATLLDANTTCAHTYKTLTVGKRGGEAHRANHPEDSPGSCPSCDSICLAKTEADFQCLSYNSTKSADGVCCCSDPFPDSARCGDNASCNSTDACECDTGYEGDPNAGCKLTQAPTDGPTKTPTQAPTNEPTMKPTIPPSPACTKIGDGYCLDSAGNDFDYCVKNGLTVAECEEAALATPRSPGFEYRESLSECYVLVQDGELDNCSFDPPDTRFNGGFLGVGAIVRGNGESYVDCYACLDDDY